MSLDPEKDTIIREGPNLDPADRSQLLQIIKRLEGVKHIREKADGSRVNLDDLSESTIRELCRIVVYKTGV